MLHFHQVGVALPTLISLRQSITKLRELVSIGPRTGEIACARAADRPGEIGFGFIQGHWNISNRERRGLRPLMPLQCVTSRNPHERRVRCPGGFSEPVGVAANFFANVSCKLILSSLQVGLCEVSLDLCYLLP